MIGWTVFALLALEAAQGTLQRQKYPPPPKGYGGPELKGTWNWNSCPRSHPYAMASGNKCCNVNKADKEKEGHLCNPNTKTLDPNSVCCAGEIVDCWPKKYSGVTCPGPADQMKDVAGIPQGDCCEENMRPEPCDCTKVKFGTSSPRPKDDEALCVKPNTSVAGQAGGGNRGAGSLEECLAPCVANQGCVAIYHLPGICYHYTSVKAFDGPEPNALKGHTAVDVKCLREKPEEPICSWVDMGEKRIKGTMRGCKKLPMTKAKAVCEEKKGCKAISCNRKNECNCVSDLSKEVRSTKFTFTSYKLECN